MWPAAEAAARGLTSLLAMAAVWTVDPRTKSLSSLRAMHGPSLVAFPIELDTVVPLRRHYRAGIGWVRTFKTVVAL